MAALALLLLQSMAANPIAVPGTVIPGGAGVSPGGAQGVQGLSGITTSTADFTVPAVGSTVVVNVVNSAWMVLGEFVYVNNAGGAGLAGAMQITNITGNQITLLNPTPAPAIPLADATQSGLLKQLSGATTDYVGGDNACHPLKSWLTTVQTAFNIASIGSANSIVLTDASMLSSGQTIWIAGGGTFPISSIAGNTVTSYQSGTVNGEWIPTVTVPAGAKVYPGGVGQLAAASGLIGLVPTPPNDTSKFLRGDATFALPSLNAITTASMIGGWPKSVTISVPFKADLLVSVTASCYSGAVGVSTIGAQFDSVTIVNLSMFFNEASSHKMLSNYFISRGVAAGNHTLGIVYVTNATADSNDTANFGVVMIRVP
jgi:hypothetical protein